MWFRRAAADERAAQDRWRIGASLTRLPRTNHGDGAVCKPRPAKPKTEEESPMKGVVFIGDRKLELRDFPDPTPGPRDVVLEIKASGMCGSALHTYRAPPAVPGTVTGGIKREAGTIAGHEPCGVVVAVGSAVSEREAKVGQRVMCHHYDGC